MKHLYAVLTGDLVGSSAADPERRELYRRQIHATFERLAVALPKLRCPNALIGWQVFRGDSFQAVLRDVDGCVRVAVMVRAGIRSFPSPPKRALLDARVAVGLGPVDLLREGAVSEGDGPAFRLSGRLLDSMGKSRLAMAGEPHLPVHAALSALPLVDAVVSRWTARQAQVAFLALQGYSGRAIAAELELASTHVSRLVRDAMLEPLDATLNVPVCQ